MEFFGPSRSNTNLQIANCNARPMGVFAAHASLVAALAPQIRSIDQRLSKTVQCIALHRAGQRLHDSCCLVGRTNGWACLVLSAINTPRHLAPSTPRFLAKALSSGGDTGRSRLVPRSSRNRIRVRSQVDFPDATQHLRMERAPCCDHASVEI